MSIGAGIVAAGQRSSQQQIPAAVAGAFALLFLIALIVYLAGRRQALILSSASHTIKISIGGADKRTLRQFARAVEMQQVRFLMNVARGELPDDIGESEEYEDDEGPP